jgi:hypothetical protein
MTIAPVHASWIPAFAGMTALVIPDARSAMRNPALERTR